MNYKTKSAVLFLIFNRPDKTKKVFDEIRKSAPERLYIAADGPRVDNKKDNELCKASREIIKMVDWDCSVNLRLNQNNEGCKISVSNSIGWFFNNEEEGIILEDDCLPDNSFFRFCDEMLDRYRHNHKITHIGGTNFQNGIKRNNGSYYFSRLIHVWGWAGWKRSWHGYDIHLLTLENNLKNINRQLYFYPTRSRRHLANQYRKIKLGILDTWDYQYGLLNLIRDTYAIIPNINLVENIGFDQNATHTFGRHGLFQSYPHQMHFPLIHPEDILVNIDADNFTLKNETPSLQKIYSDYLMLFIRSMLNKLPRFV